MMSLCTNPWTVSINLNVPGSIELFLGGAGLPFGQA
jgi:hypothetical protein